MCLSVPLVLDSGEIFLARILSECVIPITLYWGRMIPVCPIIDSDNFDHLVKLTLAGFLHCKGNFASFN